jgi:hypothetical protein
MSVTLVGMGYLRAALKRAEGRMKKAVEQAVREEMERMIKRRAGRRAPVIKQKSRQQKAGNKNGK